MPASGDNHGGDGVFSEDLVERLRAEIRAEEREQARQEARASVERLLDMRDWQVHFFRWDVSEMHLNAESGYTSLLNWLPEEILGHMLPTNRTVRAHLELVRDEVNRVWRDHKRREEEAYEQKLTSEQYRRKFDPLTGTFEHGDPDDPDDVGRVGDGPLG